LKRLLVQSLLMGMALLVLAGCIRQMADGHFAGIDTLVIRSEPEAANVYKNVEYMGKTPCNVPLHYAGTGGEAFDLTLKKAGYKPFTTRISRDDLWPKWNSGDYKSGSVFGAGNTFAFNYKLEDDPVFAKAVAPEPARPEWVAVPPLTEAKPLPATAPAPSKGRTDRHRRIALVIGNGSYVDIPLKNPENDARELAAALSALDFEVSLSINADKRAMVEAIQNFGNRASDNVALFFFAGHGLQFRDENYLLPIGAVIHSEADVEFECVSLGRILGQLDYRKSYLNIVILDACRNNPLARSFRSYHRGLAVVSAPRGSIIAYATAPGQLAYDGEGRNSVYTKHLLRYIREPGLSVERFFKAVGQSVSDETGGQQRPWISSDFFDEFSFRQ